VLVSGGGDAAAVADVEAGRACRERARDGRERSEEGGGAGSQVRVVSWNTS
jgi:hypothetical protein